MLRKKLFVPHVLIAIIFLIILFYKYFTMNLISDPRYFIYSSSWFIVLSGAVIFIKIQKKNYKKIFVLWFLVISILYFFDIRSFVVGMMIICKVPCAGSEKPTSVVA